MNVYLCGPINGCSDDDATAWRNWLKKEFLRERFEFIDPMDRDYRGREEEFAREIVELDKRDIRICDAVVCMHVRPSVGASMEVFFAWALGIPVIVIDESGVPLSPWLRYHATTIVDGKPAAASALRELFDRLRDCENVTRRQPI